MDSMDSPRDNLSIIRRAAPQLDQNKVLEKLVIAQLRDVQSKINQLVQEVMELTEGRNEVRNSIHASSAFYRSQRDLSPTMEQYYLGRELSDLKYAREFINGIDSKIGQLLSEIASEVQSLLLGDQKFEYDDRIAALETKLNVRESIAIENVDSAGNQGPKAEMARPNVVLATPTVRKTAEAKVAYQVPRVSPPVNIEPDSEIEPKKSKVDAATVVPARVAVEVKRNPGNGASRPKGPRVARSAEKADRIAIAVVPPSMYILGEWEQMALERSRVGRPPTRPAYQKAAESIELEADSMEAEDYSSPRYIEIFRAYALYLLKIGFKNRDVAQAGRLKSENALEALQERQANVLRTLSSLLEVEEKELFNIFQNRELVTYLASGDKGRAALQEYVNWASAQRIDWSYILKQGGALHQLPKILQAHQELVTLFKYSSVDIAPIFKPRESGGKFINSFTADGVHKMMTALVEAVGSIDNAYQLVVDCPSLLTTCKTVLRNLGVAKKTWEGREDELARVICESPSRLSSPSGI